MAPRPASSGPVFLLPLLVLVGVSAPASQDGTPAPFPAATAAATSAIAYERLKLLDFAALKLELEQAGWPATHVQAFLNVEIQRRLNPPPELRPEDLRPFEFWHTGPDAEPLAHLNTPALQAAQARREEAARVRFDTLFPPAEQSADKLLLAWEERRRWGDLPEEKRRAVAALLERAGRERDAFLTSRGGLLAPGEHRQLWEMTEHTRAALAGLLTAEELLDYDLRNSATADRMRAELDNFQPTREEFLAIFRLRHGLELAFDHKLPGLDPGIDRQRAEAEAAADRSIAALLGPDRYDDYRLSLQPACQTLQFDGRFARSDATTVRRLYRALLATRNHIQETDTLTGAERTARIAELKRGLHEQFRLVLDEEGTRRYLQEQALWP